MDKNYVVTKQKDKWVWFRKKRVELGDGHIVQYTLFESKRYFGVILYNWKTINQNRFHSHAFSAYAFLLNGSYDEEVIKDGKVSLNTVKNRFYPRYIPQNYVHRILKARPKTWTLVFIGPWMDYWFEYFQDSKKWVKYGWGRKKIDTFDGDETSDLI